jgi:hypothetical protein
MGVPAERANDKAAAFALAQLPRSSLLTGAGILGATLFFCSRSAAFLAPPPCNLAPTDVIPYLKPSAAKTFPYPLH